MIPFKRNNAPLAGRLVGSMATGSSMLLLVIFLCLLLAGCSRPSNEGKYIDTDRLRSEALAIAGVMLAKAPLLNGYQQTQFDGLWLPVGESKYVDLTSQSRLIYLYASAYDLTGDKKYLDAVRAAADFMLLSMRRSDGSGWYKAVHPDGKPANNEVHPYGYSFAIFGLSHAYRTAGDNRYLQAAMDTWQSGVWPGLTAAREFAKTGVPSVGRGDWWSQNPFMHLFEALLSLHDITGSAEVWNDIEAMSLFLVEHLIQPCKCMPEWFRAAEYKPDPGTEVYLGHQIEWAYLLSRAVERGLNSQVMITANNLLDFALRFGLDIKTGGLRAESKLTGEVTNSSYWWWAQAELMRAAIHFARNHGRTEMWDIYQNAHLFARIHYINQELGGWTGSSPFHTGKPIEDQKQVIGYHAMAFYAEALALNQSKQ